jgi:hypothetical protein
MYTLIESKERVPRDVAFGLTVEKSHSRLPGFAVWRFAGFGGGCIPHRTRAMRAVIRPVRSLLHRTGDTSQTVADRIKMCLEWREQYLHKFTLSTKSYMPADGTLKA